MQARAQQSRQLRAGLAAALLQQQQRVAVLLQALALVEQQVAATAPVEMMTAMICRLVRCWPSVRWWVFDTGGVSAALLFSGVSVAPAGWSSSSSW
jgi:hypothetical protein